MPRPHRMAAATSKLLGVSFFEILGDRRVWPPSLGQRSRAGRGRRGGVTSMPAVASSRRIEAVHQNVDMVSSHVRYPFSKQLSRDF